MAEVTGLRNNALPYPVYGVPWGVVFPMLDADGDLVTGATTPDAERSLNGDTFADCTNESTEIATSSGMYYLLLTAAEMTADVVAVIAKSATAGMKTTPIVLYPAKLPVLRSGTAQTGAAGSITLDSGASALDDYFNGCLIVTTGGTGTGQARVCSDYTGSSKVAAVSPNWATTPDATTTFTVYLPWGRQFADSNMMAANGVSASSITAVNANIGTTQPVNFTGTGASALAKSDMVDIAGAAVSTSTAQLGVNAVQAGGTAWGSGAITAASIAADAITDAKVAADVTIASVTGAVGSVTGAVGSVTGNVGGNVTGSVGSIATGGIAAASFAAGAIDAAAIAANAIGASELAADAVAEIADAVWEEAIADHSGTVGSTAEALGAAGSAGDPWATALPGAYGAGSAGKIIGDNINATISSRLASASYTAPDNTSITAIKAKTDNLPSSPAAVGSAMTLTSAYDFAKGTAAMTEAYAANGVAPTPVQALFAMHQMLMQFSIASTSITVKKLDNTTTAFTVTLDSATAPTSAVRT